MSNKHEDTTMKTAKKSALVPKLRFPEFRDAGEWSSKPMSEVYSYKGNNSLSRDKLNYENGLIRNIHYGDIHTKFSTLFDITKEVVPYINESEPQESIKAENYCIEGDIIFADASEDLDDIGKSIEIVNLNGERVVSGSHTILARQSVTRLVIGFGGYLFKSHAIRKQIKKESQGTKVLGLSGARLAKITIPFPSDKTEQQKIADCLASLDDLIAAQSQKIDVLKAHKKGLMQMLFPLEDETLPRLRFSEFRDDWYSVPLGKCFTNIGGTALEKYVTDEGKHHFISIGNYSPEGKYIDKGQRVEINDITNTKLLNKNDLVMVLNDKTLAGDIIGSTLLIDKDDKYIYNQRSERLIVKQNLIPIFAWHLLNSESVRKEVFKRSQGGTQIYVNFPAVKAIDLQIPKEQKEQKKIADCLASLDDLITAQTQKLAALRTHKKGLMQQIFPVLDEV